jgi:hypothetical protein
VNKQYAGKEFKPYCLVGFFCMNATGTGVQHT